MGLVPSITKPLPTYVTATGYTFRRRSPERNCRMEDKRLRISLSTCCRSSVFRKAAVRVESPVLVYLADQRLVAGVRTEGRQEIRI